MKLKSFAVMIGVTALFGCATQPLTNKYGNPVSAKVDYQCKQQCGFYDPKASIVGSAICMNECVKASGE